jgi:FMN phosphatase YigB (HAD superfamily)
MIGDSWDTDILGAMNVGIDQVHYAPKLMSNNFTTEEQQVIERSSCRTWRIGKLKILFEIVKF